MTKIESTQQSPERFSPDRSGRLIEFEHQGRYRWAAQLAPGAEVLDAGCGSGYGTAILAQAGSRRVVGVDTDPDLVAANRRAYAEDVACEFYVGDLRALDLEDDAFDLVTCFEVIEHIDNRGEALRELRRVLRDGGVLLISSPNREVYLPGNPYHVHEYLPEELREELAAHFGSVVLYRQTAWLASAIFDDASLAAAGDPLDTTVIKAAAVPPGKEPFTVAVAHAERAPSLGPLVFMGDTFDVRWWQDELRESGYKINELQELRSALEAHVQAMESSVSWRVTSPLRALRNALQSSRSPS